MPIRFGPWATVTLIASLTLMSACQTHAPREPTVDRGALQKFILAHMAELEPCYEQAIDERPGAEGKMLMHWDVAHDGAVSDVRVKDADPRMAHAVACVSRVIAGWRFPEGAAPDGQTAVVYYPFYFSENGRIQGRQNGSSLE